MSHSKPSAVLYYVDVLTVPVDNMNNPVPETILKKRGNLCGFCGKFTEKGTLAGYAIVEHSQERIQHLDFSACQQLEKLVALFIRNYLQSLVILRS